MKPSDFIKKKLNDLFLDYSAKGGTQSSLAKEAGIAQGQISVWLKGGNVPSIDNLESLAKAFGVSLFDFFPAEHRKIENSDAFITALVSLAKQMDDSTRQSLLATAQALLNVAGRTQLIHKAKNSG